MPFLSLGKTAPYQRPVPLSLFNGDPELEALPQPRMWAVVEPLTFLSKTGVKVTAPVGSISDLASTPKILQWIGFLDDDGLSRPEGIIHDIAYKLGRERGKFWCDCLLEEMCLSVGMKPWQAHAYYLAVHWFGNGGWKKDGANKPFGDPYMSNFASQSDYDAFMLSGGSIYS